MTKIRVLFLAANPVDTIPLALDEEIRAISQKIRLSEYRDLIEIISGWAVRPEDLLLLLNQHKPHIVHFCGHGNQQGIILKDNNGQSAIVRTDALKALFTTLRDNIRVVILNSCYSKPQAEAIAEVIDCVIGMNTAISDKTAITFVSAFYQAIGFGRSVREAFEQGVTALMLENTFSEDVPELVSRQGIDPSLVRLIQAPPNLEADRLHEILRVTDEILSTVNGIVVENEDALIPFLLNSANRSISRENFHALLERQEHRGEFGEWRAFLSEQLLLEKDPGIADVIDELLEILENLHSAFYSYAEDLYPFTKWDFLAGLSREDIEISDDEIKRIAREYLDFLRNSVEKIGACVGKLRSKVITLFASSCA